MLAAGALAFAAAAVVSTGGSALADPGPPGIVWDHTYRATGVVLYVEEHGDIVSVCDTAANGHAAEVLVVSPGPVDYTLRATDGEGTCATRGASSTYGGYDLPENTTITLSYDGDTGTYDHYTSFVNDN